MTDHQQVRRPPMSTVVIEHLDATREQRVSLERLSLEHGNAECLLYRSQGIDGVLMHVRFDDDLSVNLNENGERA